MSTDPTSVEKAVRDRYSAAAGRQEASLCCSVEYDSRYLSVIPQEVLERDYGCGDPSRYVRPGETVLDLGSGGGKICFIATQIVGAKGRVIGVDMNDEMLALAESARQSVGNAIGYHNVEFHKGKIQDLALDYRLLAARLDSCPVRNVEELEQFEAWKVEQRRDTPMIGPDSVDVIVSNCVLNLVRPQDKQTLFGEMYRVLRKGGRAVISDIVSNETIPTVLQNDAELWSGCISGAFREDLFLNAFEDAGFHGVHIVARDERPWRVIDGIEFRSLSVAASKGEDGACVERRPPGPCSGPADSCC